MLPIFPSATIFSLRIMRNCFRILVTTDFFDRLFVIRVKLGQLFVS